MHSDNAIARTWKEEAFGRVAVQFANDRAATVRQTLIHALIRDAKSLPADTLIAHGCVTLWDEVKLMASVWGGASDIDYESACDFTASHFMRQLHELPPDELHWLCLAGKVMGPESDFITPLDFEAGTNRSVDFDQLVPVLMEQLMDFANQPEAQDIGEEEIADERRASHAEACLKYLLGATRELAYAHASGLIDRIADKLVAQARTQEAYGPVGSECQTHWDEICELERDGYDNLLYETMLSTIDSNALAAFKKLTEDEQYALWVRSDTGEDYMDTWVSGDGEIPEWSLMGDAPVDDIVKEIRDAVLWLARRG